MFFTSAQMCYFLMKNSTKSVLDHHLNFMGKNWWSSLYHKIDIPQGYILYFGFCIE
ncbi:uncharacterized protein DS421_13g412350 [Arachis hypogaea]|nr:uncharacterized protein DS421_13g412350 [Arachis hypogaea]